MKPVIVNKDVEQDRALRRMALDSLCSCKDTTLSDAYNAENVPLGSGSHTSFIFGRCERCGRYAAIPKSNAELFIELGPIDLVSAFYDDYLVQPAPTQQIAQSQQDCITSEIGTPKHIGTTAAIITICASAVAFLLFALAIR